MLLRFKPKEFHHLYVGLLLILVGGVWLACTGSNWALLTILLGLWVSADDVEQHYVQVQHPEYRSLLHRLFQYLWHKIFGNWWPFKF